MLPAPGFVLVHHHVARGLAAVRNDHFGIADEVRVHHIAETDVPELPCKLVNARQPYANAIGVEPSELLG
jgi:hypothetical protein